MIDYNKRLAEVDEILNYLSEDELLKIPEDVRKSIKDNKDKEYIWKYDETKSLKDQEVNRDTIAFLSYLNMEYLLDQEQKKLMEEMHKLNEEKREEEKKSKYDSNDLFKNKRNKEVKQEESLIEYKQEKFLAKIINKIKVFFKGKF